MPKPAFPESGRVTQTDENPAGTPTPAFLSAETEAEFAAALDATIATGLPVQAPIKALRAFGITEATPGSAEWDLLQSGPDLRAGAGPRSGVATPLPGEPGRVTQTATNPPAGVSPQLRPSTLQSYRAITHPGPRAYCFASQYASKRASFASSSVS